MVICFSGPRHRVEREKFNRPLKEFGSPAAGVCVPKRYLTRQADVGVQPCQVIELARPLAKEP
jgi:hypothetical protein